MGPLQNYEVTVRTGAALGSDTAQVFTGPGVGVSHGVGTEQEPQGIFSITGSQIYINDTLGSESVEIHHFTGSQIIFDPDGSIFVIPNSRKGFGLVSPRGDGLIAAKNHLVFKADGKMTVESDGDLELNVGKNFYLNVDGDMITRVKGAVNTSTDGMTIHEYSSDVATTVAGNVRNTIAGNKWEQISGDIVTDAAGEALTRIRGKITTETQDEFSLTSSKKLSLLAKEELAIVANQKISIDGQMEFDLSSQGNMKIASKGTLELTGEGIATLSSSASTIVNGPTVNLRGTPVTSTIIPITSGVGPSPATARSPASANAAPRVPVVASSNTVIDAVTSARRYPEIPLNLNREPATSISILQNEGTQINPRAVSETAGSAGGGQQVTDVPFGEVPENTSTPDVPASLRLARRTTFPAPTSLFNPQERLSRNITVGMFPGITQIPESFAGLSKREIVDNIQNLCFNILDPLWERFGSRIVFTSLGGWRQDSRNHNSGKAADVRAANRTDYAFSAEVATWVRDNLPYSKILLEKNNYNTIHAHLESARPGSGGGGTILTCSTPTCSVSTPGIQLSFATAALTGRFNG